MQILRRPMPIQAKPAPQSERSPCASGDTECSYCRQLFWKNFSRGGSFGLCMECLEATA